MKYLLALVLSLLVSCAAYAQPQHVGVMVNTQIEGAGTGNGAIVGVEGQWVHQTKWLTFVNNLSITADKKGYLNSYGVSPRLHSRARYHIPQQLDESRTFIEAGFNLSGVQYTGEGGYAKFALQPVAGFGFDFSPPNQSMSLVASYNFNFKAPLHAQKSFANGSNRILDGWSWGQKGKLEVAIPATATSKWVYLANVSAGRSVYRRNPAVYGAALGAELHRFTVIEVSVGFGRLY